jgi:hypothetical protein
VKQKTKKKLGLELAVNSRHTLQANLTPEKIKDINPDLAPN